MLGRTGRHEVAIAPVAKDLECVLPDGRRPAPDQDGVSGMGRFICWDGPWERKPQISGHGVEDSDKVISENDCLLGGKSSGDLEIGVSDTTSHRGLEDGMVGTLPKRYSGTVQNS